MNNDEKKKLVKHYLDIYDIQRPGVARSYSNETQKFIEDNVEKIRDVIQQMEDSYKYLDRVVRYAIKIIQKETQFMRALGLEENDIKSIYDRKFIENNIVKIYEKYNRINNSQTEEIDLSVLNNTINDLKIINIEKALKLITYPIPDFYSDSQFLRENAEDIEKEYMKIIGNKVITNVSGTYDGTFLVSAIEQIRKRKYEEIYDKFLKEEGEKSNYPERKLIFDYPKYLDNANSMYLEETTGESNNWELPHSKVFKEVLVRAKKLVCDKTLEKHIMRLNENEMEPQTNEEFSLDDYNFMNDNIELIFREYIEKMYLLEGDNCAWAPEILIETIHEIQKEKTASDKEGVNPITIAKTSKEKGITSSQIENGKAAVEEPVIQIGDSQKGED